MTATMKGGGRPTKVGQFNGSYRENEDERKKCTRAGPLMLLQKAAAGIYGSGARTAKGNCTHLEAKMPI